MREGLWIWILEDKTGLEGGHTWPQRQKAAQNRRKLKRFCAADSTKEQKNMSEKWSTPTRWNHKAETDRWSTPTVNKLICLDFSQVKGISLGCAELWLVLKIMSDGSTQRRTLKEKLSITVFIRSKGKVPRHFRELPSFCLWCIFCSSTLACGQCANILDNISCPDVGTTAEQVECLVSLLQGPSAFRSQPPY